MSYLSSLKVSRLFQHLLLSAMLTLAAAPLGAQTVPGPGNVTTPAATPIALTSPTPTLNPAPGAFIVGAAVEHDISADLKDSGPGNMSVTNFEIYGNYTHSFRDTDRLTLGAEYLYRNFDFRGTGSPFGDVQQVGVTAWYAHDFNSEWGAFGYLYGGFAAEKDTSFSDGGQLALAFGPTVNITKNLSVAFGPELYSRMGTDGTATIMADMEWAFLPQWNLRLYAGLSDGATVSYDVFNNQSTMVDASLAFNDFWFRVKDAPGGTERGVNETDVSFTLGVRQAFAGNFFVRGFVSVITERKYQFYQSNHASNSFKVDPTVGLGVELGVSF